MIQGLTVLWLPEPNSTKDDVQTSAVLRMTASCGNPMLALRTLTPDSTALACNDPTCSQLRCFGQVLR